ncbi:MAG: glycosyltransferase, partial [Candidatus Heimdallarchaeaceae archaeon]
EIKGAHRFLPSMAFNPNYNVKEVPVKYTKRIYGKSKYHLSRIVIGLVSLIKIRNEIKKRTERKREEKESKF